VIRSYRFNTLQLEILTREEERLRLARTAIRLATMTDNAGATPAAGGGSGRQAGTPGRGSNDNNRRFGGHGGGTKRFIPRQHKFEGNCVGLKGRVFDLSRFDQADRFTKTLKKICIYVGSEYAHGGTMAMTAEKLTPPVIAVPPTPSGCGTDQCSATDKCVWKLEAKEAIQDKKEVKMLVKKLHALVLGQCMELLASRVTQHQDWATVNRDMDGIGLLKIIKSICYNFEDQKYVPQSIHEASNRFFNLKQAKHELPVQCYERYCQTTNLGWSWSSSVRDVM